MIKEFYEFAINGKLMKQGIPKLRSTDLKFKSERYPYFKINKNLDSIWAKMKNKSTLNAKLTI